METKRLTLFISLCLLAMGFPSFSQGWEWARQTTYPRNNSFCELTSINSDSKGNVYEMGVVVGKIIFGPDTILGDNAYLVKYDSAGNVKWATQSTFSGHNNLSSGVSSVTDKAGNVYLCGDFADTIVFGTDTLIANTIHDMFLVKYNSAGHALWAKCGKAADPFDQSYCGQITMDSSGYIYITGQLYDTVTFDFYTISAYHTTGVFLLKYDSAGNVIWAKTANSPPNNVANSGNNVQVDAAGYVYVAGDFNGILVFDRDTIISPHGSSVFIAKYDPAGNVIWVNTSKKGISYGSGETIDNAGNIYMAGYYADTVYFGAQMLIAPPLSTNSFIVKYNSSGGFIWANSSNVKDGFILGCSLCSDKYNNIYLSGSFSDTVKFGTLLLKSDSSNPTFLVEYDSSGKAVCGTVVNNDYYFSSPLANIPNDSGVYFESILNYYPHIVLGPDTVSLSNGGSPAFLAKWKHSNIPIITINASADSICPGEPVTLTANGVAGATYLWSPGGATTSTITVSLRLTQVYEVIATLGANRYTDSIKITVIPLPSPIVAGRYRVCTGTRDTLQVSGAATYKWSNGSTSQTYITPPIYADSTFYVIAYNTLGCSITDTIKVDTMFCGTGVIKLSDELGIKLIPNPNNGIFLIEFEGTENTSSTLEIYTMWGEKIISQMLSSNLHEYPIDMSNDANGIYFYRVLKQDSTAIGTGKVIIEK